MSEDNELKNYLIHDFDKTGCMVPRDLETERFLIRKSKLEYAMRTEHFNECFPDGFKGTRYIIHTTGMIDKIQVDGDFIEENYDYELPTPYVDLYGKLHSRDSRGIVDELADRFLIPDSIFYEINQGDSSVWQQAVIFNHHVFKHSRFERVYNFINNAGSEVGVVSIFFRQGKVIILPVSSINLKGERYSRNLYLPFKSPCFFNENLLRHCSKINFTTM